MAEEKEKHDEPEEKGKSKNFSLKWITIGGVFLLVVTGAFAGWSIFMKGDKGKGVEVSEASIKKESQPINFPLDPFIVNLRDDTGLGKRYLKVSMELELGNEKGKGIVEKQKAQIKDTILLLLSSQTVSEINSVEGKMGLKQGVISRVNQVLGAKMINKVYFTEFVVQ